MHVFKHPKYYTELRKRNRDLSELQRVKPERSVPQSDQAISLRAHDGECERAPGQGLKPQAASTKLQAPSESSIKPQASSPKQQASSLKPQASSSRILEPRKSFTVPEPRCSSMINVLLGCLTWKLIWCGENRILLPLVTFNSTVKKWPEVL